MEQLTWEDKLHICQALSPVNLIMREPGNWYVSQPIEVHSGAFLESRYGQGRTPQLAVEAHWAKLTLLHVDEYIVAPGRACYRWERCFWKPIIKDTTR